MTDVLSHVELRGLKEHKYSVAGSTLFDPYMQIYWKWLVELIPLWWAPNALTLVGLLINVFTTLILFVYSPDAKQEAPSWAYFITALGLFIYQSLDAIDGKQARRTNSASPLGELFDHGCDAVSLVFVMLGVCIALQLGYEPNLFMFMMLTSMFIFYSAHWATYCTGTLRFGLMDVTEAQFGIMIVYVFAGFFGPSLFSSQIPYLGLDGKMVPYTVAFFGALYSAYSYFCIIFIQGGVGKSQSTVADTSVLGPAVPASFMLSTAYFISVNSPGEIYQNHPVLYLLMFGLLSAKITCKLVVAHMARSEMELLDSSFIGPLLHVVNQQLLNCRIPEYYLLWVTFIYVAGDLWLYVMRVCKQLCNYLDIYCFKITAPKQPISASPSTSTKTGKVVQRDRVQTRSGSQLS